MNTKSSKIRDAVRDNYSKIAEEGTPWAGCGCGPEFEAACCAPGDTTSREYDNVSSALGYSAEELKNVPEGSNMGLGCGNPQAIAALKNGETVLDLGSGAGFDVFLAANQVGETGKVIGVDMTPTMISKARANAEKGNYTNVEFRLGEIEHLPLADKSVDVMISNCVINLSPEKQQVFNDTFRVLKPGGRIAVSDVMASDQLPEKIKNDVALYASCVSGASTAEENRKMLENAGFVNIEIKPNEKSKEFIEAWSPGTHIEDYVVSAMIEAIKP